MMIIALNFKWWKWVSSSGGVEVLTPRTYLTACDVLGKDKQFDRNPGEGTSR